jgi:hypothetical protein
MYHSMPNILPLLDILYEDVIEYSFDLDVCQARLRTLQAPCAFYILIKLNGIPNNTHLIGSHQGLEQGFASETFENPSKSTE